MADTQLSLSDFLIEMQKGNATSNWDVVVSYSTSALNSILKNAKLGDDKNVKVQVTGYPYLNALLDTSVPSSPEFKTSGQLSVYNYTLYLEPPQLQFVTSISENACDVTMLMTDKSVENQKQWEMVSVNSLEGSLKQLIAETHLKIFATELSNLQVDSKLPEGSPYFAIQTSGDYLSFFENRADSTTHYFQATREKPEQRLIVILDNFSMTSDYSAAEYNGKYYKTISDVPKVQSWTPQYTVIFTPGAAKLYQYAVLGYQGKTQAYVLCGLYTAQNYLKVVQPGSINFYKGASISKIPKGLTWVSTYWGETAIDNKDYQSYAKYNNNYYIGTGDDPKPSKTLFSWRYVANAPQSKGLTGGNIKTASVSTQVGLASITGELSSSASISSSNNIAFGSDTEQAHIVLDFSTTNRFTANITGGFSPEHKKIIDQNIEFYFSQLVKAIDYPLNGFNNKIPKNTLNLTPKKILFASDPNSQSLSLFVETNLGQRQGSSVPSVNPGGNAINPIPLNADATIIFSNSLIGNNYIAQQLDGSFSTSVDVTSDPGTIKMPLIPADSKFNIKMPSSHVTGFSSGKLTIDDLIIDYNKTPINMSLHNDELSLSWKYSYGCKWKGHTYTFGAPLQFYRGTFKVILTFDQSKTLTISGNSIPPVNTSIQPTFAITGDVPASTYRSSSEVRDDVQTNVNKNLPTFDITFEGLNFFNTANVLIPSGSALSCKAPKGNKFGTSNPMFTPYDLVMTANIITS